MTTINQPMANLQQEFETLQPRQMTSRVTTRRDTRAVRNEVPEAEMPEVVSREDRKARELKELLEREQKACGPRFKLTDKIGEGTYGIVFKAQDMKLNQVSNKNFLQTCQNKI